MECKQDAVGGHCAELFKNWRHYRHPRQKSLPSLRLMNDGKGDSTHLKIRHTSRHHSPAPLTTDFRSHLGAPLPPSSLYQYRSRRGIWKGIGGDGN